ncbi:DNA polymerase III subunit chi [Enterovirga rhinocerotis]|uniref:DNA polymerase III chi subunit n=1 Tax=Enterovirga rhinocerotis TaxID=1339210 RepID=A0A4R7C0K6_9HYPH|nr:DNA polymerase III subunit chi [Enterovirga rhinocerotis]TDR90017.1 DNA polymerase III chi subunit [Enterovirga rhinocerotis]
MTDIHFYHLQRQTLEAVLPTLLMKSRERGWRALVKIDSEQRLASLDDHLWAFSDESFLPHGTDREPEPDEQPILLTQGDENRNGAAILFLAEGADPPSDLDRYERVVLMLDGRDEDAVAAARESWRRFRGAGHAVTYWQQDEDGRWQKRG